MLLTFDVKCMVRLRLHYGETTVTWVVMLFCSLVCLYYHLYQIDCWTSKGSTSGSVGCSFYVKLLKMIQSILVPPMFCLPNNGNILKFTCFHVIVNNYGCFYESCTLTWYIRITLRHLSDISECVWIKRSAQCILYRELLGGFSSAMKALSVLLVLTCVVVVVSYDYKPCT